MVGSCTLCIDNMAKVDYCRVITFPTPMEVRERAERMREAHRERQRKRVGERETERPIRVRERES